MELIKIALPYFGPEKRAALAFFPKDTVQTVLNNGAVRPKIDSGSCGPWDYSTLIETFSLSPLTKQLYFK